MPSDKATINHPEFTKLTHGHYINQYVLQKAHGASLEELSGLILELQPNIDSAALRELLNKKIRCNAGIIPLFITSEGSFVVCAQSQRTGEQTRGALVNAMGLIEDRDNSVLDGALRELDEELGKTLAAQFYDNLEHSIYHLRNEFGKTIEEVALNILKYQNKTKRSLSFYGTILIPVTCSFSEACGVVEKSNREDMALNSSIYHKAVNYIYPEASAAIAEVNFVELAHKLLPKLSEAIKLTLIDLLYTVSNDNSENALKELVKFLIDITENKGIILVQADYLYRLYEKNQSLKQALVKGIDLKGEEVEIFSPSLDDFARLLESTLLTSNEIMVDLKTGLKKMIKNSARAEVLENLGLLTPILVPDLQKLKNALYKNPTKTNRTLVIMMDFDSCGDILVDDNAISKIAFRVQEQSGGNFEQTVKELKRSRQLLKTDLLERSRGYHKIIMVSSSLRQSKELDDRHGVSNGNGCSLDVFSEFCVALNKSTPPEQQWFFEPYLQPKVAAELDKYDKLFKNTCEEARKKGLKQPSAGKFFGLYNIQHKVNIVKGVLEYLCHRYACSVEAICYDDGEHYFPELTKSHGDKVTFMLFDSRKTKPPEIYSKAALMTRDDAASLMQASIRGFFARKYNKEEVESHQPQDKIMKSF